MAPVVPAASAAHSRFVQRIRRRYTQELAWFAGQWPGAPLREAIQGSIDHFLSEQQPMGDALRITRQLVIERLATLDVEQQARLSDVTSAMTQLAEVTLQMALALAQSEQDAINGPPLNEQGQRIDLWIVGMGKLGGRELNVSSDIDLVYVYEDDGMTTGVSHASGQVQGVITAHEYFSQVVRRVYALIGDTTEHGFVFRVDLALRPNGNSGPAVVSLAMLEEYFLIQGREWERFAWLKSRIVAPAAAMPGGARHPASLALRDVVAPFVYRRYLDYGVFEGLRQLHHKIREEATRRAAGRPDRANDVKLSRGGIREIEFTVQLLQVVRGGQFPEIRTRSTLKALKRLSQRGLLKAETAQRLANSYVLLRQIEHRIQYLDDQQTHLLPREDQDLQWIAASLGLTDATATDPDCRSGACQLMTALCQVREFVASEFDALLHDGRSPQTGECKGCGQQHPIDSADFHAKLPDFVVERVQNFASQSRVTMLTDASKQRLARLVHRACQLSADMGGMGEDAVLRFIDWLTPLLRRDSYLSLLAERPEVLHRLLRLLGLARWPMRYLMLHPGVIDELADPRLLEGRFDREGYIQELTERHRAWEKAGEASEEALLDALRRAHHAEVFRTLVRDVDNLISVEQVADDLSALADATVDMACRWAWSHLQARPGKQALWAASHEPRFAIIAYGKLGGKELGYGSDLDLVFLYDLDDSDDTQAAGPDAPDPVDAYVVFARKLITWLTLRTPSGDLFDIDMALRPNGNSGLLVTSITSFDNYQRQRGSNTAWTWEHQALSRARWCAGDPRLLERFETTRRAVLSTPRETESLRQEIHAMRERLRQAHPGPAHAFDLKHGQGGMIDIEFAVQYLVLAHSHAHPELMDNVGNIALLSRAEHAGLLPHGVGTHAAQAYRAFRRLQHRARLDEAPTTLEGHHQKENLDHIQAGLMLWNQVFPPESSAARVDLPRDIP